MQTLSPLRFLFLLLTTLVVWQGAAAQGFEKMWEREGLGEGWAQFSGDGKVIARLTSDTTVLRIDGETGQDIGVVSLPDFPDNWDDDIHGTRVMFCNNNLYVVTVVVDTAFPVDWNQFQFEVRQYDVDGDSLLAPAMSMTTHPIGSESGSFQRYRRQFYSMPGSGLLMSTLYTVASDGGRHTSSHYSVELFDPLENKKLRSIDGELLGLGRSDGGKRYAISTRFDGRASSNYDVDYVTTEIVDASRSRVPFDAFWRSFTFTNRPPYVSNGPFVGVTIPLGKHGPMLFRNSKGEISLQNRHYDKWYLKSAGSATYLPMPDEDVEYIGSFSGPRNVIALDTSQSHEGFYLSFRDLSTNKFTIIDTLPRVDVSKIRAYSNSEKSVLFVTVDKNLSRYAVPPTNVSDTMVIHVDTTKTRVFDSISVTPLVFTESHWTNIDLRWGSQSKTFIKADSAQKWTWRITSDIMKSDTLHATLYDSVSGRTLSSSKNLLEFWRPSSPSFIHRSHSTGIISLVTDGRYVATAAYRTGVWPDVNEMSLDSIVDVEKDQSMANIRKQGPSVYAFVGDSCILANQTGYGIVTDDPKGGAQWSKFITQKGAIVDTTGKVLRRDSTKDYKRYKSATNESGLHTKYQRDYVFDYNEESRTWAELHVDYKGVEIPYQTVTDTVPVPRNGWVARVPEYEKPHVWYEYIDLFTSVSVDCSYGTSALISRGTELVSVNLLDRVADTLITEWMGSKIFDAIQVDSNRIVTTAGLFIKSSFWQMDRTFPFTDAWEVEKMTHFLSFVMRHNRDTVGVVVNHFTGEILQTLGQSVREARSCAYDSVHKMILIGDDAGVVLGYDVAGVVSVNEEPPEEEIQVRLYPNVTESSFTVELDKPMSNLEVYTIEGMRVVQQTLTDVFETRIDLKGLPNGSYFVRVRSGNNWYTTRLIKQ